MFHNANRISRTFLIVASLVILTGGYVDGAGLPRTDLEFLRDMTLDVIKASTVVPGSNGGGSHPLTNACGFPLITPGKDTYPAFWLRDFSMAADSGLISPEQLKNHLLLICKVQNGAEERKLAHGLHLPPWSIPDHINYDGHGSFFPGSMGSGDDQGDGMCGRVPPIDDHYEFVHLAYLYWKTARDLKLLQSDVGGISVYNRLQKAFASPTVDEATGLAETTETDRAVGFGFCDAEVHTGKLLVASLLRYRAAGELSEMAAAFGEHANARRYRDIQKRIAANIMPTFSDKAIGGWLRASTGMSRQPDVWGTLCALHLGLLGGREAALARKTICDAVEQGGITYFGGVRHVPTNLDFSKTTSWERSISPVNTYQNGAYWHTASGWLIEQLWKADRRLARSVFADMMTHLREDDFRKGHGRGAPWEDIGPGGVQRNAVYMASVALPYSVLKKL